MSNAKTHTAQKKALVPELRFKEYEGEWKDSKLGELGDFSGGGTPSTNIPEYWEGETPWISSSDVNEGDVLNLNITRYLTKKAIIESATKLIPQGSVLFVSRVGVGKLAVSQVDLCTSQDFANLIPKKGSSFFIAYYFVARNKLLLQYSQGTSIKGFTTGDLKSIPIKIPSLPEQQKIASFLSAVDEKIQQLTKKKALLEQYKKGVMQQLFSQKLRFKQEDGSDYPEWEEKRLGEVCECMDNLRRPLNDSERQSMQGTIPYWGANKVMDYVNDYLFDETLVLLAEDGGNFNEYKTRPIANLSYGKCWVNNHTHVIKGKNELSNEFLFYSLVHKNITGFVSGGTRAKLNKSEMLKIPIEYPIFQEQQKIASYLSSIDSKIESVNDQITQTQTFKKGLLQKMFV